MELKNYPSGDEEFDNWFRETQPGWAAEIDAQIAKDQLFAELLEALESILDDSLIDADDGELALKALAAIRHTARATIAKAKGE